MTDAEGMDIGEGTCDLIHVDFRIHYWKQFIRLGIGTQGAVNRLGNVLRRGRGNRGQRERVSTHADASRQPSAGARAASSEKKNRLTSMTRFK